jgi:predicted metal-dependent phosphoesterase TrpH
MSPEPSASAVAEHPHLAAPRRAGWVRVDMHSHTMWSGDSTTTIEELAEAVATSGLDVLCITDHNAVVGAQRLVDELACRVIVGEELKTHAGELIGLFLSEHVPFGLRPLEAAAAMKAQGAVTFVPHPFDPMRHAMRTESIRELAANGLLDAVEAFNAKTSLAHLNEKAAALAVELGLPAGAGSDAHVPAALGAAYVEMPDFDGPADFLRSLRQAVIVGHHYDKARPWSARIIPSVSS